MSRSPLPSQAHHGCNGNGKGCPGPWVQQAWEVHTCCLIQTSSLTLHMQIHRCSAGMLFLCLWGVQLFPWSFHFQHLGCCAHVPPRQFGALSSCVCSHSFIQEASCCGSWYPNKQGCCSWDNSQPTQYFWNNSPNQITLISWIFMVLSFKFNQPKVLRACLFSLWLFHLVAFERNNGPFLLFPPQILLGTLSLAFPGFVEGPRSGTQAFGSPVEPLTKLSFLLEGVWVKQVLVKTKKKAEVLIRLRKNFLSQLSSFCSPFWCCGCSYSVIITFSSLNGKFQPFSIKLSTKVKPNQLVAKKFDQKAPAHCCSRNLNCNTRRWRTQGVWFSKINHIFLGMLAHLMLFYLEKEHFSPLSNCQVFPDLLGDKFTSHPGHYLFPLPRKQCPKDPKPWGRSWSSLV